MSDIIYPELGSAPPDVTALYGILACECCLRGVPFELEGAGKEARDGWSQ